MKNIIKTFGLLAIFVSISGAFAATSRVSVTSKASPRLPSIAGHIISATTTSSSSSTSTTSYLTNSECIEKYTDCVKDGDVCGSDFEECTTNVLFHGQMSKCLSVLYQCQSTGITALFGTSAINALSTVSSTNAAGEVTRYTYPTDGSVLGQLIIGAGITNKMNTEQCIKSYTRCLNRDEVCGADFELCTTDKEFKKQALLCDSTLQRCQSEGKTQLFGSVASADSLKPSSGSRLRTMIENGQSLAAMNAVKTCQKVTDNCLISACTKNPLRCVEGISLARISSADIIESGATTTNNPVINSDPTNPEWSTEVTTATTVQKLLKSQCLETIGGNQYCHMAYREKVPSKKDLVDIDLQEDVFSLAYSARKAAVNTRIQEAVKKFDTRAKDACYATIKSCAMRSCGGGLGSVCYKQSRSVTSAISSVNSVHVNGTPYNEIQSGCAAIVNADANCIYAATSATDDGYAYTYYDDTNTTFTTLFPQYTGSESDVIGAVGQLNALLQTSYNDAAIEDMKKQCQTIAKSCVRSKCGTDYINCYRNRTDVVISGTGTYDTGSAKFDHSMNKMGGILDYNIVMGLCMDSVKNTPVCEEHLKVASANWRNPSYKDTKSWGGANSVRDAWLGANTTKVKEISDDNDVLIACRADDEGVKNGCTGTVEPSNGKCIGISDEDGCIYDTPVYMSETEYVLENAAKTLFQQLLMEEERNVQGIYNAKLTKEQNICYNNNNGGILGKDDNGSTFMWAKLKSSKIPKDYQMKGLKTNQFGSSNDLYGSFCRVRVTVKSDDKYIQDNLGEDATAYFAVGDAFTCGSWIKQQTLQKISNHVADQALVNEGLKVYDDKGNIVNSKKSKWALGGGTAIASLLSGIAGYTTSDVLQRKGTSLGGLLVGENTTEDNKEIAEKCLKKINDARGNYYLASSAKGADNQNYIRYFQQAVTDANSAKSYARKVNVSVTDLQFAVPGAYIGTTNKTVDWNPDIKHVVTELKKKEVSSTDANKTEKEKVTAAAAAAEIIINIDASKATDANKNTLKSHMKTISTQCSDLNLKSDFCKDLYIPDVDNVELIVTTKSTSTTSLDNNDSEQTFVSNLKELEQKCEDIQNGKVETSKLKNWGTALATGALGGGITFTAIKAAQDIKSENIQSEAIQQWMNEIGDHIQCYVGADEVGTYGDVISIEID